MPRVKVPVPAKPVESSPPTPVIDTPAVESVPTNGSKGVLGTSYTSKQALIAGVFLGFLLLIIMLFNVMSDKNKLQSQVDKLSNPASVSKDEVNKIIKEISAFYQLPTGETPTLATVSDASKVKNQAFFANAQNGDKVLLYSKAGQAILYRPSTKKIISVAPVDLNGTDATSTTNSPTSN